VQTFSIHALISRHLLKPTLPVAKVGLGFVKVGENLFHRLQETITLSGRCKPTRNRFMPDGAVERAKDGVTPLSLAEWAGLPVSKAPHPFESNAGGGAAHLFRRRRMEIKGTLQPRMTEALLFCAGCRSASAIRSSLEAQFWTTVKLASYLPRIFSRTSEPSPCGSPDISDGNEL